MTFAGQIVKSCRILGSLLEFHGVIVKQKHDAPSLWISREAGILPLCQFLISACSDVYRNWLWPFRPSLPASVLSDPIGGPLEVPGGKSHCPYPPTASNDTWRLTMHRPRLTQNWFMRTLDTDIYLRLKTGSYLHRPSDAWQIETNNTLIGGVCSLFAKVL